MALELLLGAHASCLRGVTAQQCQDFAHHGLEQSSRAVPAPIPALSASHPHPSKHKAKFRVPFQLWQCPRGDVGDGDGWGVDAQGGLAKL